MFLFGECDGYDVSALVIFCFVFVPEDISNMRVVLNHTLGPVTDFPDTNLRSIMTFGAVYPTYQECFEFCLMNDDCNVAIWTSSVSETSGGCFISQRASVADLTMGGTIPPFFYVAEMETETRPCMYAEYELILFSDSSM